MNDKTLSLFERLRRLSRERAVRKSNLIRGSAVRRRVRELFTSWKKMALPCWSGALKIYNFVQRARPSLSYLCVNGRDRQRFIQRPCIVDWKFYSSDEKGETSATGTETNVTKPKKKKVFIPKVTLLSENNEISIVTMEMAERLASRRNLKLVKIVDFDTKTERPTYKLMSTKDYIQEGMQRKKLKKMDQVTAIRSEKMVSLSTKIAEHDLVTKMNSIAKLLAKKHEIRIVISMDGNKDKATAMAQEIEKSVKELSVQVNTKTSGNNVKIYLRPIMKIETDDKAKDNKIEPVVAAAS